MMAPGGHRIGRYVLFDTIASGGMASVHFGRMLGPVGFRRTVAIKRLHPHLATDPAFVTMFLDEAHLAARVQHPNVVGTIDVVSNAGELFIVMDYVQGESLSRLLGAAKKTDEQPINVAVGIIDGALYGLHAAHEATSEGNEPLGIVHRDVSPQNILVGIDGVTRVADFGVAKAVSRLQSTRDGQLKGKSAYMAPEQLLRKGVDRRADVYAATVVLWEVLTQRRLFVADDVPGVIHAVLEDTVVPPSHWNADIPAELDAIVMRGLARNPAIRFATALEMVSALERVVPPAPPHEIAAWVLRHSGAAMEERRQRLAQIEQTPVSTEEENETSPPIARAQIQEAPTEGFSPEHTHDGLSVPNAPARSSRMRRALFVAAPAFALVLVGVTGRALLGTRESVTSTPKLAGENQRPSAEAPMEPPPRAATLEPKQAAASATSAPSIPHKSARPSPAPAGTNKRCDPPFFNEASPSGPVKRFKPWCI